jgi:signal transduction histidine kinase
MITPMAAATNQLDALQKGAPTLDWTQHDVPNISTFCREFREYDWAATQLGPIQEWPNPLRQHVLFIMAHPKPRALFWGPDAISLYNEAATPVVAALGRIGSLGKPAAEAWPDVWRQGPGIMFETAMRSGTTTQVESFYLELQPTDSDRLEETYWSLVFLPLYDADGCIVGVVDEFDGVTNQVIKKRHSKTIKSLDLGRDAKELADVWKSVLGALEANNQDAPFALLYSVKDSDSDLFNEQSRAPDLLAVQEACEFEGSVGIVPDYGLRNLKQIESSAFTDSILEAWRSKKPVVCQLSPNNLPKALAAPTIPGRGFDSVVDSALVLPIPQLNGSDPIAILIVGTNPRRRYDAFYQEFICQFTEKVSSIVASVQVPKHQRHTRNAVKTMTREHAALSDRLLRRTQLARQSEQRFKTLADSAPVGMCLFTIDGDCLWRNEAHLQTLCITDAQLNPSKWHEFLHPSDLQAATEWWQRVAQGAGYTTNFEMRIRKACRALGPDEAVDEKEEFSWIMMKWTTEHGEDDSPLTVMTWAVDITHQKNVEELQNQRVQEALEQKRASENFIDVICHELRNPLSAVLLSAESISESLEAHLSAGKNHLLRTVIESIKKSADVVSFCTQHEKRIIDDVLTLSKLDSKLIVIASENAKPVLLLEKIMQIHEAELTNAGVEVRLQIHPSYADLGIVYTMLDTGRLLQVLINLFSNACKFIKGCPMQVITLHLAASTTEPVAGPSGKPYVPRRNGELTLGTPGAKTNSHITGEDTVFLQLAVEDTGPGMSPQDSQELFHRFSQASPKTYGQYGGSGLGLFISRELIELQGGRIGVHSELGRGTTFFFYIQARKVDAPPPSPKPPTSPKEPRRAPVAEILQDRKRRKLEPVQSPAAFRRGTREARSFRGMPLVPTAGPTSPSAKAINVLLVEDNMINQRLVQQRLTKEGCVVHVANNGEEALAFISRSSFARPGSGRANQTVIPIDVVLCDIEMPVMDGLTCVRRFRELEAKGDLIRHLPVIAATANARREHVENAITQGMVRILVS